LALFDVFTPVLAKHSKSFSFIDEAIVLAHSGVISLLPDHVIVHPGFMEDSTPSNKQQIAVEVQQDVNLRRGADLLLARKDVDPKRLAYGCNTKMGQAGAAVPTFLTRNLTR
jgi:hypothetical protein